MRDIALVGFIVGLDTESFTEDELREQALVAVEEFDPDDEEAPVGLAVWLLEERHVTFVTGLVDRLSDIKPPPDEAWDDAPDEVRAEYAKGRRTAQAYLDGKAR